MKTQLVNFFKKLGKTVISFVGILLIIVMFMISLITWGIVVNFVDAHQWIILIPDLSCIILLVLAIRENLHMTFDTTGKRLFYVILLNIALLIFMSFGAVWNFLILLFVLLPTAIGFSRLKLKDLLPRITMEWALSISSIGMSLCVLLAVLDSHIIYIVIQCLLIVTMLFVWFIAIRNKRRQKMTKG